MAPLWPRAHLGGVGVITLNPTDGTVVGRSYSAAREEGEEVQGLTSDCSTAMVQAAAEGREEKEEEEEERRRKMSPSPVYLSFLFPKKGTRGSGETMGNAAETKPGRRRR